MLSDQVSLIFNIYIYISVVRAPALIESLMSEEYVPNYPWFDQYVSLRGIKLTHALSLSLSLSHTHTHTHIYTYIFIRPMDILCQQYILHRFLSSIYTPFKFSKKKFRHFLKDSFFSSTKTFLLSVT